MIGAPIRRSRIWAMPGYSASARTTSTLPGDRRLWRQTLGKKKWAMFTPPTLRHRRNEVPGRGAQDHGHRTVLIQVIATTRKTLRPLPLPLNAPELTSSKLRHLRDDLGIFAKQLRQLGVNSAWIGSASNISQTALRLAGSALYGTMAVADFNRDSSPAAKSSP